jgi:hypothetical protein
MVSSCWPRRSDSRFEGGGTTVGSAVADIVQCGLVIRNPLLLRGLNDAMEVAASKQLISWDLWGWLGALDNFRNWVGLGLEAHEKK